MIGSKRMARLAGLIAGGLIIIAAGPAKAVPLTLPSGKIIELTPRQVEMLRQSPGVYYFDFQPDKFTDMTLRHWILLELPPELGGGFIVATPHSLAQGLDRIKSGPGDAIAENPSLRPPGASVATLKIDQTESPHASTFPEHHLWRYTLDVGYRLDELDWSIAGNAPSAFGGNFVNVLSELTWRDLEIFQLEFGLARKFANNILLKGSLAYGLIFGGENQDSDYAGNDRTLEFSRSNNNADEGNTWDGSIGVGYSLAVLWDTLSITPLAGFSIHIQNLTITDGFQTIPPIGPFAGLDSTYDTRWYGPWLGISFSANKYKKDGASLAHELLLGLEYHWADYYADANWNLRTDFAHPKSFEHEADGSGIVLSVGYHYFFNRQWSLNVKGKYQSWETDPGIDRVFFADGSEVETPLNEVNWTSFSLMVGVTCSL